MTYSDQPTREPMRPKDCGYTLRRYERNSGSEHDNHRKRKQSRDLRSQRRKRTVS